MIYIVVPFISRQAMAFYPFVLIKKSVYRTDKVLMNHERIHLAQQKEMLFIPFYLVYLMNYLYNLISMLNHEQAYKNIIFEKEAYDYENCINYIHERKSFSFIYYL